MKSLILCAFPGTCTTDTKQLSKYSYVEASSNDVQKNLEKFVGKIDVVIFSHKDLQELKAVCKKSYKFTTVLPSENVLGLYQDRWDDAGKPESFVENYSKNWSKYRAELAAERNRVVLFDDGTVNDSLVEMLFENQMEENNG